MKEELLRVLNTKLDDIKINIESLNELNEKIKVAEDNLSYIQGMLNKFTVEDNQYNVLNFTKLSREDFDSVLLLVRNDVSDVFSTNNCNYEGLVYLINGINNGVSLSLTIEQENAINYLISEIEEVVRSDMATVDGLYLVKARFAIDDVSVLENKKAMFENIIDKSNNDTYIDEVDYIKEAMEFNNMDSASMNEILLYLLKNNAEIYNREKEEKRNVEVKMEDANEVTMEPSNMEIPIEIHEENESLPEITETSDINSDNYNINDTNDIEFHLPEFNKIEEESEISIPTNYEIPIMPEDVSVELPNINEGVSEEMKVSHEPVEENKENIDNDFNDIVPQNDYEEYKPLDETVSISPVVNKTSTRELQRLFQEFGIDISDDELNGYVDGDAEEYRKIIELLKDNKMLNTVLDNREVFKEIIVNSKAANISNVLNIISEDLSVDNDDYEATLNIAINTIPSVFVENGGNYYNFVENVKLFKDLGINLINLFDFSKEVFVANHENVLANYEIVKTYNVNIDYNNAKYYLLLNNIGDRFDYYVESKYEDKLKKETFDGLKFIAEYPNKLNSVCGDTIKRLRYSSENGKKVFGSKSNSLAGEITNLKVNVLEIPDSYLNNFFDNHFEDITDDEVRQYDKLCHSSSNVGDYLAELSFLEEYHKGLRYVINDVIISYNKVLRNYNTLRSYGIEKNKALIFAVCHNLVITKDEYQGIKKVLTEGVGE